MGGVGLRPPTLEGAPFSLAGAGRVQRCRKSGPREGAREEAGAGHLAWQGHSYGDPVGCHRERVFLVGCSLCYLNSIRKNKRRAELEKLMSVENSAGFILALKTEKNVI